MQYRVNQKNGDKLSVLGYGCMRYTRTGGSIDQEKAEKEMKLAVDAGVNYFDTAYIYNGCEECLGKFMEKYDCRSKINVATKLPQYYIKKIEDVDRYFAEQLRRLKTDYVDYYLLHMLNDAASFNRLCELGIREWIADKKAKGIIRNIGFSFHGSSIKFIELIDAYDWFESVAEGKMRSSKAAMVLIGAKDGIPHITVNISGNDISDDEGCFRYPGEGGVSR